MAMHHIKVRLTITRLTRKPVDGIFNISYRLLLQVADIAIIDGHTSNRFAAQAVIRFKHFHRIEGMITGLPGLQPLIEIIFFLSQKSCRAGRITAPIAIIMSNTLTG